MLVLRLGMPRSKESDNQGRQSYGQRMSQQTVELNRLVFCVMAVLLATAVAGAVDGRSGGVYLGLSMLDPCPSSATASRNGSQLTLLACEPFDPSGFEGLYLERVELPPQGSLAIRQTRGAELLYVERGEVILFDLATGDNETYGQGTKVVISFLANYGLRNEGGETSSLVRLSGVHISYAEAPKYSAAPQVGTAVGGLLFRGIEIQLPPAPALAFLARVRVDPRADLGFFWHPGVVGMYVESGTLEIESYPVRRTNEQEPWLTDEQWDDRLTLLPNSSVVFPIDSIYRARNEQDTPATVLMAGVVSAEWEHFGRPGTATSATPAS